MGFWGTFFLCLIVSPLLGVIISALSGNKETEQNNNDTKNNLKELLLKEIEKLKKEEELDLISEEGKEELIELTYRYKNYDSWYALNKEENKIKKGWVYTLKRVVSAVVSILIVLIVIWLLLLFSIDLNNSY